MGIKKTYEEINEKIKKGEAVVVTAEEMVNIVKDKGVREAAKKVDVVTTGTFSPMCSSGAFLNFGHSDPPIRTTKCLLNGVPAYSGLAAVDCYIGVTEPSEFDENYGGAHVIEDLISGKRVKLHITSYGTDCYPCKELDTHITLKSINQAFMFNPRNAYQNYNAATNTSSNILYTYMGILLPKMGNITYSSAGELSPLLNDPLYRTIGIGTRIFLCGAQGYIVWEGTQFNKDVKRDKETKLPEEPAGTLAVIGNLKQMSREFMRAAKFQKYGITMFIGIGIPIPILDEDLAKSTAVSNADIFTNIVDYSTGRRERPTIARVSYKELQSGRVKIGNREIPTAPISSIYKARQIANVLKNWIEEGNFLLNSPVQNLPVEGIFKPLKIQEEIKWKL